MMWMSKKRNLEDVARDSAFRVEVAKQIGER